MKMDMKLLSLKNNFGILLLFGDYGRDLCEEAVLENLRTEKIHGSSST